MNSLDGIYKRQLLNEEYKIWKKNAPFMYDLVITHILEWTSLSVEWLPIFEVAEDPDLRIHNLVLGTDCPEGEKNHLLIVKVKIPKENIMVNLDSYAYSHEMKPGYYVIGQSVGNVEIEKKIPHEGEVIKTKYMPQDPNIIATKTNSGEIHLFNINLSYMDDKPDPELRLQGHSKKGSGLDWNENRKG